MENKKNEVAKVTKNITDKVLAKINHLKENGGLLIPKDYAPENALKSAYLILSETVDMNKKPVLQNCTEASIANSLLDMVTQGLNPAKKQCYFIPYGGKLQFQRSYLGAIAIAKRNGSVKKVIANAIYQKDKFVFAVDNETGLKKIIKHEQTLESLSSKVTGAYAILTLSDDTQFIEVMNIDQINNAWNQRKGNGLSPAHKNFADEMAKKSVINRACKLFISTSDDAALYEERETPQDKTKVDVSHEIKENANKENMNFEEAEIIEEPKNETVKEPVKEKTIFPENETVNPEETKKEPF